jgi:hypothetical protein
MKGQVASVPYKHFLVLLTVVLIGAAISTALFLPASQYDAIGSLVGGVGSLLAVIWFTASLFYQSVQLEEQRKQFSIQFNQSREEARRAALAFSQAILRDSEERISKQNPNLKALTDMSTIFVRDLEEFKTILESKDANQVMMTAHKWLVEREGPAGTLMRGIRDAAETYFRAIGKEGIDYTKEPEEFVFIYGPLIWNLLYFSQYVGIATMIAEMMLSLKPGRKAVWIAYSVAMLKAAPAKIINREKVLNDLLRHRDAKLPVPAIAEDLANNP